MNLKKLRRLYRAEKLAVRNVVATNGSGNETAHCTTVTANEQWSLDFVNDAFTDGRWFRVLAIVDDFT